jgi:hypothetical protein
MVAVRAAGRLLVAGWLLSALLVLGIDGRLVLSLILSAPVTLLVLGIGALVRQQRAPSLHFISRPKLPDRYRVADDLRQPLAVVVEVAEQEAVRGH